MFLVNNPLANMYGPYFLLFHGLLLAIFCWLAYRNRKKVDESQSLPRLPVPENPNPYEVAYLRGGDAEVARLITVELFQRGILVETPKRVMRIPKLQLAENVNLQALDPNLASVAASFRSPRSPLDKNVIRIQSVLGKQLEQWKKWVSDERLVFESSHREQVLRFAIGLAAVFEIVGIYKLIVAITHGHMNVGFLFFLLLIGLFAILATSRLPRFTQRGKRYLEDLQAAYSSYKNSVVPKPEVYEPQPQAAAWDPLVVGSYAMPVMAMGLFGATALQSSYYSTLRSHYMSTQSASCGATSGCGSSCGGGSGCGGGGCGGGCGGCGS